MSDVTLSPPAGLLDDPLPAAPSRGRARRSPGWLRQSLDVSLRGALIFLMAQAWLVQGYRVYGCCMEPNLHSGERLLGSRLALVSGIHRGDVVVFQPPQRPGVAFIKRVIGLPGEVLAIRDNHVYVNGRELNEPYLHLAWHDDRAPERVPAHMVYVMGDNRDNSNDSRSWGELPVANIQAKAWVRYWPPSRLGWIR